MKLVGLAEVLHVPRVAYHVHYIANVAGCASHLGSCL